MEKKYRKEFNEYMSDAEYNSYFDINDDSEEIKFGEIIFNLRKEYGYTQEDVANMLGVKQNTLSRYEQGERQIPLKTLIKILKIYGLKLEINVATIKDDDKGSLEKFVKSRIRNM